MCYQRLHAAELRGARNGLLKTPAERLLTFLHEVADGHSHVVTDAGHVDGILELVRYDVQHSELPSASCAKDVAYFNAYNEESEKSTGQRIRL